MSCDPNLEPAYVNIASVSPATSQYVDGEVTLYPAQGGGGVCTYLFRSYSYKIEAVDNTFLNSVRSDRGIINGYIDPCAPHDNPLNFTQNETPAKFTISNYPNPFNPSTEIRFSLPTDSYVTVKVYNAAGELVSSLMENEYKLAGYYNVRFDGTNLASGIYFYRIDAGSNTHTKKMVLIK